MWHRRNVSNHIDTNTKGGKRTNRRFATRSWTFDLDIKVLDTLFNGCATSNFRSYLSSKWSRLTRTFETLSTGRCPRQRIALTIGDCNDRVIKRSVNVCNTVSYIFTNFFANTLCCIIGGSFCHGGLSIPVISSMKQQPYAGLCEYVHLCVCVDHALAVHDDAEIHDSNQCPSNV